MISVTPLSLREWGLPVKGVRFANGRERPLREPGQGASASRTGTDHLRAT